MINKFDSNFNKIGFSKKKSKKNIFLIIILIILFLFIFLYFIYFMKNKTIDNIIKFIYKEKIINKQIFEKLKLVWAKLIILEKKELSNEKIINSYHNNNIYYLLSKKKVLGYKKIRIGNNKDGGYILLNDLKTIKIGYSFGISREISFDKGLADKNIDVFMYDHVINKLPFENPKFHWKKIGLTGSITNRNNMKTLSELIFSNGHSKEKNMILKMDIESYEWNVFQYLPFKNLRQFKYIVGEFHFSNSRKIQYYYNILKKLLETHQIFHIHCNNCGRIIKLNGYAICNLLEISFILKEGYTFADDENIYPIEGIDYKNCIKKKDISYLINLFNK